MRAMYYLTQNSVKIDEQTNAASVASGESSRRVPDQEKL